MDISLPSPKPPPHLILIHSHKHLLHHHHQASMQNSSYHHHATTTMSITTSTSSSTNDEKKWAEKLLRECAKAISDKDSTKIHHFLWMLNELSSPYGDTDQKLASYFLQALFCKATDSGDRSFNTLISIAEKNHCFETARKVILKFQEVSPWTTFGHVASNCAILEALEGEAKLHIIDMSNTYCTQWPTLLEALATRNDDTPHLRLSVVVSARAGGAVIKEIGQRMEKFARLMGVPFEFQVVSGFTRLGELKKEDFSLREDEVVAINLIGALRRVNIDERSDFLRMIHQLKPKVVTVVEEEADFTSNKDVFVMCFEECLRFYGVFFEMLQESFGVSTSNERLMLERECSRSILSVLACEGDGGGGGGNGEYYYCERREKGRQWSERLRGVEFMPVNLSDDALDDVRALLKRYQGGWSLVTSTRNSTSSQGEDDDDDHGCFGVYLAWKDEAVVWASAWKPS
ncbi:Transcription factor GRAS domain-containing protein [Dioscorea alata]|uniref:Transcription factor GRAS domain-containing protein n=1 Tax=Dioscorea alata TaxID=55571 RepID=A0ACB7W1A3_DIOAL|nr:Transcription factor GRAS domain-containing protein [Dioscorea alata]